MLKVLFERVHILISLSADTFLYLQALASGFKFFWPSDNGFFPEVSFFFFLVCVVKEEIPVSVWGKVCHTIFESDMLSEGRGCTRLASFK